MAALTKEQQLAKIKEARAVLDEKEKKILAKGAELVKGAQGIQAAMDAIQKAADDNKVAVADVIIAIAKFKRTGLKINKATRKPNAA